MSTAEFEVSCRVTFRRSAVPYSWRVVKRILTAALAIGLLSACAGATAPGSTKADTPQQSLATTGKAMAKLTSVRFNATARVTLALPQALVDELRAKAGPQAGFLSSNTMVDLSINGAVAKPDQLDATITAKVGGLTVNTEVIATGGRLYAKDPMTGNWRTLAAHAAADSDTSKTALLYQAALDTAKSLTEINDQPSTIDGVSVDHYRVVPDLLKLFTQATAGHASKNPQSIVVIQDLLQNSKLTADVWTGTNDHLVRRFSYDADVTADLSVLAAALANRANLNGESLTIPAGSVGHLAAHAVINLHDFNARLTIKAPTVAA